MGYARIAGRVGFRVAADYQILTELAHTMSHYVVVVPTLAALRINIRLSRFPLADAFCFDGFVTLAPRWSLVAAWFCPSRKLLAAESHGSDELIHDRRS